jgi:hypothetical protein
MRGLIHYAHLPTPQRSVVFWTVAALTKVPVIISAPVDFSPGVSTLPVGAVPHTPESPLNPGYVTTLCVLGISHGDRSHSYYGFSSRFPSQGSARKM